MSSNKAKPIKLIQILVMVEDKSQLFKKKIQNQKLYKRKNKPSSPSNCKHDVKPGLEKKKNFGETLP